MTAQYSMKFGEVETVVADLRKATNDIRQQLSQLEGNVKQLVAHWSGDAVQNYEIKQKDWNDACARLEAALANSGRTLENVFHNTQSVERSNASMFTFGR
ncbi:WXG100 family type VII secretion target [Streptomyces sp. TLI_235]|nr:WXG100 family type VII secretion target [Streptomyces sp. TLI_235]PBC69553.1 WXG100 family type VII secretion target [Streptomyces sp. TLI_235]